LIDNLGVMVSSIIYRVLREGIAINININAGMDVQNNSISWASRKNRLKDLLTIDENIKWRVRIVTLTKMIIEWSWKNVKCSINGEFLSWNDNLDQVGIS